MSKSTFNLPNKKIPWNLIGQILFAAACFYLLTWVLNSLSFTGRNGGATLATPTISALEIFDNFGFKVYDTTWNEGTWAAFGSPAHIQQFDGILTIERDGQGFGGLYAHHRKWQLSQVNFVQARLMLSSAFQSQAGEFGIELTTPDDQNPWFARCEIQASQSDPAAFVLCKTAGGFSTPTTAVAFDTWHMVKIMVDPSDQSLTFFVDDQPIANTLPPERTDQETPVFLLRLFGASSGAGSITGSFDDIQLKNR